MGLSLAPTPFRLLLINLHQLVTNLIVRHPIFVAVQGGQGPRLAVRGLFGVPKVGEGGFGCDKFAIVVFGEELMFVGLKVEAHKFYL